MTTAHRPRLAIHTCVLLLLGGSVVAQNPQFANVGEVIPDGFGQIIASADYEGDGDVDLFATGGLFLNEGGHFVPGPVWPAGFAPTINVRSAKVADFNGDGLVDLMAGRWGGTPSGLVLLLAPSGGGTTFGITAALPAAVAQPTLMTVADFDGDADIDVIIGNTSLPSNWELHLNDGAGSFTEATVAQWPSSGTANIYWLANGDFDGDGWIDVVGGDAGGMYWRRNLGGGTFGTTQSVPFLLASTGVVGDFNGDGVDDIFAHELAGTEAVLLGSPSGPVSGVPTVGSYLGGVPVAVDRDGDGKDELLFSVTPATGALSGELFLRPGQTSGLGAAITLGPIRYGFNSVGVYPGIAVLDVDLDGDQDTVIATGGMAPFVMLQSGTGTYELAQKAVPAGFESLFAPPRDVNGDGNVDLLRATLANGLVTLESFPNDGRGCFTGPAMFAGSFPALTTLQPTWADLDGDGDLDLWTDPLTVSSANLALLNNGAGVFAVGASVANIGPSTATVIADFNGDQVADIVVARPVLYSFPFPSQLQAPLFVPGMQAPTGVAYGVPAQFGAQELIGDMVAVDADLDGDLDLLVATTGQSGAPGSVYFYQNDGAAGFTAQLPFAGVQASTLAIGDLNGDGLDDLVLGDETWLRSGLTFTAHGSHAAPLRHISLADLDEDGALDLFDEAGRWYPGDGAGNFAAPIDLVPYTPAAYGTSRGGRVPVDFDNDGDLDAIGPHAATPGHFAIYSNLKRHAAATTLATPGNPIGLSVYGDVGSPWFLGVSLPTTGVIGLPFGPLFLDPANLLVVGGGVIPANGRADTSAVIPVNGAGFTLTWQALVGQSLRLTNAFDTPIAF